MEIQIVDLSQRVTQLDLVRALVRGWWLAK
jgi:hypothetical protein